MSTSFNNTDRLNNNLNQLRTLLNDQRSDNSINTRNTLIPLGPVINNSIPARIDTLLQLDDSSWRNLYYIPLQIINIMILIIGLYKAGNKSNEMNAYNFISICLLVINVIDLLLLLELIIRNNMSLNDILSDLSTSPFKSIVYLRTFLVIVSFPLTSIGTYFLIIVLCGGGLIFCLPSRIRAPLMMMFQQWLNATPLQMGIHLGASKESINALPIIYFGRTLDPFNQNTRIL
ncbi:unnamed protein product, partial [Rotaria magnacalcarata]